MWDLTIYQTNIKGKLMNQKQRDYLIKRLEVIKNEKIVSFKVEDPNPDPFIRKLKKERTSILLEIIDKGFENVCNNRESGRWDYQKRGHPYIDGVKIVKLSIASSAEVESNQYFTNLDKVQEEYGKYCKKHYEVVADRHKSIETKYVEMCDQIIFAEDYEQAAKLIKEFLKF